MGIEPRKNHTFRGLLFFSGIMSKYPQHFLTAAIAESGDKTIPPSTAMEAGTGRFSQEVGFGPVNAMPIGEGGIPPKREDFNGALFLLSQFLVWYQQGGIMKYSAVLDYEPGNEVFQGSQKFRCLVANGPSTTAVAPGSDKTVWKNMDAPSVIAGQITPFYNCKLGGSDGRRLIPWGESVADERYVLCDGGDDGLGGTVPNLVGKFILPSTVDESGATGGSQNVTTAEAKIAGTVGETILTVEQIPSHTHSGSTSSAGRHTHTRGTMDITGSFPVDDHKISYVEGAFYSNGTCPNSDNRDSENASFKCTFSAARSWKGSTSAAGSHSHTMSLNNTGGGKGHSHSLVGASHSHAIDLPLPPFFKLAYFVKLPE